MQTSSRRDDSQRRNGIRTKSMDCCVSLANCLHSPNNLAPGSPREAHAQLQDFTHLDLENIWRAVHVFSEVLSGEAASSSQAGL